MPMMDEWVCEQKRSGNTGVDRSWRFSVGPRARSFAGTLFAFDSFSGKFPTRSPFK